VCWLGVGGLEGLGSWEMWRWGSGWRKREWRDGEMEMWEDGNLKRWRDRETKR